MARNGKPDLLMAKDFETAYAGAKFAEDKTNLQRKLEKEGEGDTDIDNQAKKEDLSSTEWRDAAEMTSKLVARAGSGAAFEGETLGVGGLDDVLAQIKRRIWVPLAAPPSLLNELGINPVRGLLLYGLPGCGKTLLARTLGKMMVKC